MSLPQVSFVIPLYNEAETLMYLYERLNKIMNMTDLKIEIVLVSDGSTDNTEALMYQIAHSDSRYHCIFLSRNFGHQAAITAGLAFAKASEAIMIIDGDLQDPPELLFEFYKYYKEGYDVIYGVRKKRKENVLKRISYYLFYRLSKHLANINIPVDSGDFSLISRRVVDILNKMPEESRYIRGLRAWIGFRQIGVEYERNKRAAGETKYSFKKLVKLAYDGIFNFSEIPVKLITKLGILSFLFSFFYFLYAIIVKFLTGNVPKGFAGLLFVIILFSGVQLISLGIIGEYALRIFFQVKERPLFVVKDRIPSKLDK